MNEISHATYDTLTIGSLEELIKELLCLRDEGFWSFRGQRKEEWDLCLHSIHSKREHQLLDVSLTQFKKRCMEFSKPEWLDDDPWRWLFYAQHHKLRTRLLDWTTNPLVALYFAVENILSSKQDGIEDKKNEKYYGGDFGAVWALKVHEDHFRSPEEAGDPEKLTDWIMINPPPVSKRIVRQSGKFSYHPFRRGSTLEPSLNYALNQMARRPGEKLIKIVIKGKDNINPSKKIRNQLGIMNIHHAALFPDADGVAHFVNNEWHDIALSYKKQIREAESTNF